MTSQREDELPGDEPPQPLPPALRYAKKEKPRYAISNNDSWREKEKRGSKSLVVVVVVATTLWQLWQLWHSLFRSHSIPSPAQGSMRVLFFSPIHFPVWSPTPRRTVGWTRFTKFHPFFFGHLSRTFVLTVVILCLCDVFDTLFCFLFFVFLLLHRPRISKIQFKGRYFMLRVRDKSVSHFYAQSQFIVYSLRLPFLFPFFFLLTIFSLSLFLSS